MCAIHVPGHVFRTGALSGWMRYTGYYLPSHTRKEELGVPTVDACWEVCLQENSFSCLSAAYSTTGSQSCRLYDKRALSVYGDWTVSTEFTYYEYCANGVLHVFQHTPATFLWWMSLSLWPIIVKDLLYAICWLEVIHVLQRNRRGEGSLMKPFYSLEGSLN